jgi:biotin operon repressor
VYLGDRLGNSTVSEDTDDAAIFRLLDDQYARCILTETSDEPMSAKELGDACDASLSTVYRRADELQQHGLVTEQTKADADGHHFSLYQATVENITVEFDAGTVSVSVSKRSDPADQFAQIWDEIRESDR